jgi:predicted transposase/invertase (TIGR01784 family)
MLYEARELYLMDEMARREAAEAKGRAEGIAEGEVKGKLEGKLEVVRKMLGRGLELDIISEISGLSLDEIRALAGL